VQFFLKKRLTSATKVCYNGLVRKTETDNKQKKQMAETQVPKSGRKGKNTMKRIINEDRMTTTMKDLEDMIKHLQIAQGYAPLQGYWDEDIELLLNRAYIQLEELKQFNALLNYSKAPTKLGIIEDFIGEDFLEEEDEDWDDIKLIESIIGEKEEA
jgi:hypothetical protein